MNEIIFRFFLNFKNNSVGRLEITEPIGFDGATFTIEQDKKRYGRDVAYGSEEVSLDFYSGVYSNGLTFEFKNLIRYYEEFGFESEVEFIVNKDGVDFVVGLLDFQLADTDQITYFKTKVIQNTNKAVVKRRDDVNVDVFSPKSLDDKPISAVGSQNIFLKAKPLVQISRWNYTPTKWLSSGLLNYVYASTIYSFFFLNRALVKFGIEDSYTPFETATLNVNSVDDYFTLINAKSTLNKIKISLKNVDIVYNHIFNDRPDPGGSGIMTRFRIVAVRVPAGVTSIVGLTYHILYAKTVTNDFNVQTNITADIDFDFPETLSPGDKLVFFYSFDWTVKTSDTDVENLSKNSHLVFNSIDIEIKATSTAIPSVIKGVRYIDYVKQVFKSATELNVIAPKFDTGGQFYDNFVFNGKLIRQFLNEPFYGNIKDNVSQLIELNGDYQINKENVFIGQYEDFYTNNDLGAFLTAPEVGFKSSFNDRYTINTLDYKYKSFEQNKDESNTIDAIHTSSQWLLPNKQVENSLKIEVDFIRDPFEIESARRQGVNTKETTSLSNDDKVFQIDVIALPPNSRNNFTAVLNYQYSADNDTFKLISNGSFNWLTLGFNISDTIKVDGLDYFVEFLDPTMITLTYSGVLNQVGEKSFLIDYPLTDVFFTNRTNEEFDLIENIETGENFSNLQYSIGRNLEYWYSYLKTACKFQPNKSIKNTFFKSNGNAKTQFRDRRIITENADVLVSELGEAILSPYIYNTKVVADYNDVLSVLGKMETINNNNSIGGFIRLMDNNFRVAKIYPTKLSYKWATAELEVIGEVKQESEYLDITITVSGLIIIDEVGYERDIIFPLGLRTEDDYIQILDKKGIALHNEIKFDKVRVNSIIFSNIVQLSDNLLSL